MFQITAAGVLTSLYSFSGAEGINPDGALLAASDGNFYGLAYSGGDFANDGTIFKVTVHPNGALQFTAPAYGVGENAGNAAITVSRAFHATGPVSIHYATNDATAIAGTDYQSVSGTLAWADGDASAKTFTVPITDRHFTDSSTRTLSLLLSLPGGGADLDSPATATLTIVGNDSVPPPTPIPTPPPGGSLIQAVNLLSPPSDLTVLVGQTINLYVSVDVAAPGDLASVEFFAGSTDLGGSTATRDNKTCMPSVPGDYELQAVATDRNGAQATSHETIHVQTPQTNVTAPGAALLSGLDGRAFAQGATVELVASATDANGVPLQNVQFYADGVPIAAAGVTQAAGRVHAQDTANSGFYRANLIMGAAIKDTLLTLVATNTQGITSISKAATIHTTAAVVGDTLSCAITAPAATDGLAPGASTAAMVSALEPGGSVAKVEFFVNSTSVGTMTAAPYTFTIPPQPVGSYALTAIATDTAGLSKVSAPVIVSVTAPTVDLAVSGSTLVPGGAKGVLVITRTGDLSTPLDVFYKAKGATQASVDYKPLSGKLTIPAGAVKAKLKIKTLADPVNTGKRKLKVNLLPASDGSYTLGTAATVKLGITGGE